MLNLTFLTTKITTQLHKLGTFHRERITIMDGGGTIK